MRDYCAVISIPLVQKFRQVSRCKLNQENQRLFSALVFDVVRAIMHEELTWTATHASDDQLRHGRRLRPLSPRRRCGADAAHRPGKCCLRLSRLRPEHHARDRAAREATRRHSLIHISEPTRLGMISY